jgi:polyisoprenoid-binding protein YceI
MTVSGRVSGQMTIHGQSRQIEMPVKLHVDDSRRLVIEGETPLKMSDYGVEVPSKLGVISVDDQVKIWIALRARVVPTEKKS